MREIVFDTETTGLDPKTGDRIVEIGAVELVNHVPTGKHFHEYINPERSVPKEAEAIHGLSDKFLADKPLFAQVADRFAEFLGDAVMIAHNASFDMGFINMELIRTGREAIPPERIVDSLAIARRKHPSGPNSLDALCRRYGIDNSAREKHGALLDSELLAEVYLELIGGRQTTLALVEEEAASSQNNAVRKPVRPRPQALPPRLSEAEIAAHESFVDKLGPDALWRKLSR